MKMEDEHAIILIVTEDALLRKTEADILTKNGFRVIPAGRGKEAIEAIEKNGISVVLIDLDIEDVSGLDLLREIKARKPEIECILVTGFASQESAMKAINLGAFSYIKKPYDMDRLLLLVQQAAEKHWAQRALRDSEARYRRIFNTAAVSLLEEDYTKVFQELDDLKEQGVSDIRAYFDNHPEVIRELIKHIRIVDVNPAALQLYGARNKEEMLASLDKIVSVSSLEVLKGELSVIFDGGAVYRGETVNMTLNNEPKYVLVQINYPKRKEDFDRVLVSIMDITDRKQAEEKLEKANRLYAMLSHVNQAVVREKDKQSLFQKVCDISVELGKFKLAWIGLIDEEDKLVKSAAFSGEGADYLENIEISLTDEITAKGPTGKSILEGRAVVFNDLENNPNYAPWRERALEKGYRSSGSFPIRLDNSVIGSINVYAEEPNFFDEDEIKLLEEVSLDISFALGRYKVESERMKVEQSLRESEEKFRTMAVSSPLGLYITDVEGNVDYVNGKCTEIIGRPAEDALGFNWARAVHPDDRERVVTGWKEAVKNGEEFHEEHRWVHADGKVIWTLRDSVPVRGDDGKVSMYIGTLMDITDRKHAEEKLRRNMERLNTLHTIDMTITASMDIKLTLNLILDHVIRQLGVDAAVVFLTQMDKLTLTHVVSQGFRPHYLNGTTIRIGEGLAGGAALERRMFSSDKIPSVSQECVFDNVCKKEGFEVCFAHPLISKGEVQGVLVVCSRERMEPDKEWFEYFRTLAGQGAIAVDNGKMFEDIQRYNLELQFAYDSTLEGWAEALELRDKETKGHSERVTGMTLELARILGVPEDEIVHVRRGALLHDIGKMGIPDDILLKPGKLTEEEFEVIKKHPGYARQMLSKIKFLQPALDIPYYHHERWDGSGYPEGLKGEEIPLAARIFAIVDVWDAMTSDRPYRKAIDEEEVLEHIRQQSGRHFDPQVVDAFFQLINERQQLGE